MQGGFVTPLKIFLSHASQDRAVAESIVFSLRGRGYQVFLDRDDLPAGASFDQQIERGINESDAFVFLISPDSVAGGRYTLTELTLARRKWPDPNGRVLPVKVRETSLDQVPPYLKAVTILEPVGNITAETSAAVDRLTRPMEHLIPEETAVARPDPLSSKADTAEERVRGRLETFLEWSKPYRDITALAAALLVTISGFVVAALNHFATQAALSKLECIENYKLENQTAASTIQRLTAQLDTRSALFK